ncbi:MAG: NAD(P)H-hydrate dehydratase [Thermodesulfobacteriota bacterium]
MKIATREIVRDIDAKSIEKHGIPGLVLMENAGRMAADVVLEEFPQADSAAVFAGGGNNGGDGFVIARHLAGQGVKVTTYLAASPAKYKGDALANLKALKKSGGEIVELGGSFRKYKQAGLIVDALFGTGLDREVEGFSKKIIDFMNAQPVPRLAVDLPSGIDANTGFPLGAAVRADVTVTFVVPKIGISIYPGLEYAGRIYVADITTPKSLEEDIPYELLTHSSVQGILKPRRPDSHKGTYGHLFILAGSPGKTGAATLASLGALRAGTGLVTVGIPASLNDIMEVKTTEAMTEPLPETDLRTLGMMSVKRAKEIIANKKTALAIGPGISTTEETHGFLYEMIRSSEIPAVIDADALTLIAEEPGILLRAKAPLVLTPHPGEMSRLTGIPTDDIERDRIGVSLEFARKYKVILVLKGARSLVTTPGGRVYVNTSGNPGMASGGMGDVLTGIIGGFLAQRIPPEDAARLGVFVHGLAGDAAALERGQAGIIAGDLADVLPRTLAGLPGSDEEPFFRIR